MAPEQHPLDRSTVRRRLDERFYVRGMFGSLQGPFVVRVATGPSVV